jgi:hypothetical protein
MEDRFFRRQVSVPEKNRLLAMGPVYLMLMESREHCTHSVKFFPDTANLLFEKASCPTNYHTGKKDDRAK